MNPAICWGNRIIPKTTTNAAQSSTLPSNLPRTAHCLARCCCQNPRPSNTTERPKSQGRSVVKKALAAPAPRAAANPSGRQQLIVATELTIATNGAETPVPCFQAQQARALGGAAGLADLVGVDADDLAVRGDDHHVGLFGHLEGGHHLAIALGSIQVDDALAPAGGDAGFGERRALD